MNDFVGFVILERNAYCKCSILHICSVSVPTNYACHTLAIHCLCITPSLFSPKLFCTFINNTFELLDSFFSSAFFVPYYLCISLPSYNLCFSCIFVLGWTVMEKVIALIEVNSEVSVYFNYLISKVPISVLVDLMLDNSKWFIISCSRNILFSYRKEKISSYDCEEFKGLSVRICKNRKQNTNSQDVNNNSYFLSFSKPFISLQKIVLKIYIYCINREKSTLLCIIGDIFCLTAD